MKRRKDSEGCDEISDMPKITLKYGPFMKDLLKAKGWTFENLAFRMGATRAQVEDFLEATHEPRAGFAKAVEKALNIQNLDPTYYGYGDNRKPGSETNDPNL